MPNIKSAKKRVNVTAVKDRNNQVSKSILKTKIKKFDSAVDNGEDASAAFKTAVVAVDKAASKGILHKNTAARRKSRMARRMNKAAAGA